jgi:hypothetical protein
MKPTLAVHPSPVQFNSNLKNSNELMDIYLSKYLVEIPIKWQRELVSEIKLSAVDFLWAYKNHDFKTSVEKGEISQKEYEELKKLFETLIFIGMCFDDEKGITESNFKKRCEIMSEFIPMAEDDIRKYLYGAGSPITFHLFDCAYDLIFNKVVWKKEELEILKHVLSYSDKYVELSKRGMAFKLNLSRSAVQFKSEVLEREIDDLINIFKLLAPYYSYREDYLPDEDLIIIDSDVFDCIKKKEGANAMTPRFAAKVLAVIYNYRMRDMSRDGKEEYWLIRKDVLYPDKVASLVKRVKRSLRGVQDKEDQKILGKIMKCLGKKMTLGG